MNWLQKTFEEQHDLRKDGKLVFRGTANECYMKLQESQSQSADWAMKYEGWTISSIMEDWRDSYVWHAE